MSGTAQALREARRDLAGAADAQLLAATRLVDQMTERGDADRLLQPVRDRLGVLRPGRPLRFRRLLFTPLEPLIIDAPRWRADSALLPRSAVAPLEACVRRQAPAACDRIDAMLAETNLAQQRGNPPFEVAAMRQQASAQLWQLAGTSLRLCLANPEEASTDWRAVGLPASCFVPLTSGVAFLLDSITALDALEEAAAEARDAGLLALLRNAEAVGVQCWSMALCLIMLRFPTSHVVFQTAAWEATRGQPAIRAAAAAAEDAALASIGASAKMGGISAADSASVSRQIAALAALAQAAATQPARGRQILAMQEEVLALYVARFTIALSTGLLLTSVPLRASSLSAPNPTHDALVQALEKTARELRGFESTVRWLGGGKDMDQALALATAELKKTAGLSPIERARLIDILAGPQKAMRALRAAEAERAAVG